MPTFAPLSGAPFKEHLTGRLRWGDSLTGVLVGVLVGVLEEVTIMGLLWNPLRGPRRLLVEGSAEEGAGGYVV